MDIDKAIENNAPTKMAIATKAPFSWEKLLLLPLKISWRIVWLIIKVIWWIAKFILKTVWWCVKFGWFFILVFIGIIITGISGFHSAGTLNDRREYESDRMYRERKKDEQAYLNKSVKSISRRILGTAGKVWESLWG